MIVQHFPALSQVSAFLSFAIFEGDLDAGGFTLGISNSLCFHGYKTLCSP